MSTRQAKERMLSLLTLFLTIAACTPPSQIVLTITAVPASPIPTSLPTLIPSPIPSPTVTPLACLTNPGRVEESSLDLTTPPQEFRIYLPPCYDEAKDRRHPVLYLLHGQTYTDDQWVRIGAVDAADRLILSGETAPFIIVFPDDRYWNLPPGAGFGQRLVEELIPYIDTAYRTNPDRDQRAIGGLSRGAGWALRLGLSRWDLFGRIGLHSLAVLQGDGSEIRKWLGEIPPASRPAIFLDIGDNDSELAMASRVESHFDDVGLPHEWHLYTGAHTEEYWSAHVEEYLRWYTEAWSQP